MKFITQRTVILLFFTSSILFFTSCSKDSDLLIDAILSDSEETVSVEDANSEEAIESNEEGGAEARKSGNLLLNGTFANADEWTLRNGSTAKGGVLTINTSGRIQSSPENWAAEYYNISIQSFYETRRYKLTFTAKRVSGNDLFLVGERYIPVFEDALTSDFQTYVIEFNGSNKGSTAGNDLTFGGYGTGDVFEIKDVILEDIGASTRDGAEGVGSSAQFTIYTDFETDQWGSDGGKEPAGNFWEVDQGLPRTTDSPNSPLTSGRNGGRAVWLGGYNGDITRNEIGKDLALSFQEHWIGVSMNIQNRLPASRILIQNRLIANGSSSTVNVISLRQAEDSDKLYFSLANDVNFVDQTRASLGTWNGAGTNTESVYFDYTQGEWLDIVIHYKGAFGSNYTGPDTSELSRNLGLDFRSDGFIEIWVNGKKIVDHVGTTAYRYAKHGQEIDGTITPKIGPYWGSDNQPSGDVYYDNYKIWTGPDGAYQDVDPSK